MPSREVLAAYIRDAGQTDVTEIAKHFGLKGADRRGLRVMLKAMQGDGALGKRGRRGVAEAGALPPVGVADVTERDVDGDLFVRLTGAGGDTPLVRLSPDKAEKIAGAPGLGDRVLVRFVRMEDGEVEAKLIKRLGSSTTKILGVIRKARKETRVEPVDRKVKDVLLLTGQDAEKVKDGDLVVAQLGVGHPSHRYGPKPGMLLEIVGREDQPRAASLIAIHAHGIPTGFPTEVEEEAEAAPAPTLKNRTDLRDLPLVTIDPVDARDHDDAVYAQPDTDPSNEGGHVVWVAIADVAAYVRNGTALDRTAWDKGNSVYFPDRVEPMLPERLSAGLCSLVQGQDRACMAVEMRFDRSGRKIGHRFVRGLMRSAAKLSYEQAQAAIDGEPDDATGPLLDPILRPLWAAYDTMKIGREARSPLEIESEERRIKLSPEGEVISIEKRKSLPAHKLIEEMMIQANVCAAETLEQKKTPLIYRIHDAPSQEKLFSLGDFLSTIAIKWSKGEPATTKRFNHLLAETRGGQHAEIVNEVVLRTQMQAIYSPDNIGHFGINLSRYAHFTSPIRRYADLMVHRALIRALKLGDDGLSDVEVTRMTETAEHITMCERRAMAAERDATDRYVAAFLADSQGAEFEGRITGVTRFGLFVRLEDTGADGLVPVSSLGSEYFVHDDRTHALVGERTGARWRLGARVRVRLLEATPVTGGLLFEMLSEAEPADPNAPRARLGVRQRTGGRPGGGKPSGVKRGKSGRGR
ncbi:ribonuclease R [Caulobacter sp. S45]|uniref:ribonuclease R n=1 Tax=Caulobacter sp. S45 TaxID=1641861 RepID=UPI0020B11365|nr:ribonuclease R [Caulobacter sp. S45]